MPVAHMEGSVGWGMIGETLFSSYWLSLLASVKCLLTALAPLLSFIGKAWGFQSPRPRPDTFVNASDIILELL